jgi:hypothetical protein
MATIALQQRRGVFYVVHAGVMSLRGLDAKTN